MPSDDLNSSAFAAYCKAAEPTKTSKAASKKPAKKKTNEKLNKSDPNVSQFVNGRDNKLVKGNHKRTRSQVENVSAKANTSAKGKGQLRSSTENAKQNSKGKGKKAEKDAAEKQIKQGKDKKTNAKKETAARKSSNNSQPKDKTDTETLNLTIDFDGNTNNLQATSTPSISNGIVNGNVDFEQFIHVNKAFANDANLFRKQKPTQKRRPEPDTQSSLPQDSFYESPKPSAKKVRKSHTNSDSTAEKTETTGDNFCQTTFKSASSPANKLPSTPLRKKLQEEGSIAMARHHLQWLINPVAIDEFKQQYWEKSPICINRFGPNYYTQLMSTHTVDQILRDNILEFTKNIDITSYENGVRKTHNPDGRAMPPNVWDFYRDGCSIRILNPQTFIPKVHELNATLQEYFHCMTGANVYLTPPNSQGFAPHYDDIEAFVLQIEGKKMWKLYAPRSTDELLPRISSGNFRPDEIGEPILERTLEAGDLLYFPRGTIHQASTVPGHHSLHITLSVYQKTSYGDLLEILMPRALERAINADVDFRHGLPLNIWHNMGLVNRDEESPQRNQISSKIRKLCAKVIEYIDADEAVDQMATKFQHDALPPVLTPSESELTVYGTKCKVQSDGNIEEIDFKADTEIRLLRANILRMIEHENLFRIYFYTDNSKEYHEFDPNFLEIDSDMAPAVEFLIKSYPRYIQVAQLPLDEQLNFDITLELWNRGLIMLKKPLN